MSKSKHRRSRRMIGHIVGALFVWLASAIAICLSHAYALTAGILASVVGAFCYVYVLRLLKATSECAVIRQKRVAKVGINIVAGFLIVAASIWLTDSVSTAIWNPIGESGDNGWGFASCYAPEQMQLVEGPDGKSALVRRGACFNDPLLMAESRAYYVFVLEKHQKANVNSLIFREYPTTNGWDAPPSVKWLPDGSLMIMASDDTIAGISAMDRSLKGVAVVYKLGRQNAKIATTWWQRLP